MIFSSLHTLFKEKYFEEKINYWDIFKLIRYYFPELKPHFGFFKKTYHTVIIDLTDSEEVLFSKFKKSTKYKINRGKRESIIFGVEKDVQVFLTYYNYFAQSKNLERLNYKTLIKYEKYMIITKASYNDKILVMHIHIYNSNVAMLLFSASHFRSTLESKEKKLIGYANLLLHYEEMLFFKEKACLIYDFGGYAYETSDKSLIGINYFKDLFNPKLTMYYIYTSWVLEIVIFLKRMIVKMGLKINKL